MSALAVTPFGRTVAMLKVTVVEIPVKNVAEAFSTPLAPPGTIVRVEGEVVNPKSNPAGVTIKLKVVV